MKIKSLIRQIIQEQLLTEMLKSAKLRELTKFFPKDISWRGISTKFNIAVDQVTDDQVQIVNGPTAKKLLSNNDKLLAFFIYEGKNRYEPQGLMGIRLGKNFVRLRNWAQDRGASDTDSASVRGYQIKGGWADTDSGIRQTTGLSGRNREFRGDWTGGYFTAGDYWQPDVKVYIIDTAEVGGVTKDLRAQRSSNKEFFQANREILDLNRLRYKKALAVLRSTQEPELIRKYQDMLKTMNARVSSAVQIVLANPAKFRYGSEIDDVQPSGNRTYTTSLLKLVTIAYESVEDLVKEFKSGRSNWEDSYHNSGFQNAYAKIMKIVKNIESKA